MASLFGSPASGEIEGENNEVIKKNLLYTLLKFTSGTLNHYTKKGMTAFLSFG